MLGGFVTGLVVGGIGGRIAMLALRFTSSGSVIGLKTDDDFTIGRLSGETAFLLLFTAGLGILGGDVLSGGALVDAIRAPGPPRRNLRWGRRWGVVRRPGRGRFHPDLPLPLAIALFVALPAAYGVALSVLVERWLGQGSTLQESRWGWLGAIPLLFFFLAGPAGLLLVLVAAAAWLAGRRIPGASAVWRSAAVIWTGRAVLAAISGAALVDLVRNTAEIL